MAEGTGPVAVIILVMVFVIAWAIFLGKFVGDVGQYFVETSGLTGIEAFVVSNLNLFIFIFLLLGTMAWMYFRG